MKKMRQNKELEHFRDLKEREKALMLREREGGMSRWAAFLSGAALAALLPSVALAHVGLGQASGFIPGFGHPAGGLDHVMAMVMVGILAWRLGGRAVWLLPATFLCLMAVGGALGAGGIGLPFVEAGIALSVIVLGAVIAAGFRSPVGPSMALVGLFAIAHGHAHGVELPDGAGGLAFGAGFVLATALLHAAGVAVARISEGYGAYAVRLAGVGAALAGLGLLAGTV